MSWDAIVYGDFSIPAAKQAAWRETPLDATKLAGADLGIPKELVFLVKPLTVGALLAKLPDDPLRFVKVEQSKGQLTLRGTVGEDEFREIIATELACLVVAAGACGGKGELHFTSQEGWFLSTVSVNKAAVSVKYVTGHKNPKGSKTIQAAHASAGYREVLALVQQRGIAAGLFKPLKPRLSGSLDSGGNTLHAELIAALEALSAKAFDAAVKNGDEVFISRLNDMPAGLPGAPKLGPLTTLGKNRQQIIDYLRAPYPASAAAALRVLAKAAPEVAPGFAVRFAQTTLPDDLGYGVAQALAGAATAESLDAIRKLAELRAVMAAMALKTNRHPDSGALALELLEGAKKKLRAPHRMTASDPAVNRAHVYVAVFETHKYPPAKKLLAALKKYPQLKFACEKALKRQLTRAR